MNKWKTFGPFSYYKIKKTGGISAWPTGKENAKFGWEYGPNVDIPKPLFCLRLFGLNIISLEFLPHSGFEFWLLGFWWIG